MTTRQMRRWIKNYGMAGVLLAGFVLAIRSLSGRRWLILLAVSLILVGRYGVGHHSHNQGELRFTALDVGKADALVIETPSGKVWLIDTGKMGREGDDDGRAIIAPYLLSQEHHAIAAILLTHPHPDHIGGAASLLGLFPVGKLIDNGEKQDDPLVQKYQEAARVHGVATAVGHQGDRLDLGDGVTAQILAPTSNAAFGAVNDSSLVLRVTYGKTAFLLTGDAGVHSEAEMLRRNEPLACDVLKVAHHGSNAATSDAFVQAAKPRLAVISVNADNRRGYPHPDVLHRLQQCGASISRTDQDGNVTCVSDGDTVHIETTRSVRDRSGTK